MGHLARSASVYKTLEKLGYAGTFAGSLDETAWDFARSHGLPMRGDLEPSSDMVVMDCLTLAGSVKATLRSYAIRASLTALPDAPDLPTHYFLRSYPPDPARDTARYIVQPGFALSGMRPEFIEELFFDEIHVGLCLSAGKELDEWELAVALLDSPSVKSVSVISRSAIPVTLCNRENVKHSTPTHEPWRFLDSINVFVGGDGVMLGEALKRGLPVFSVTDEMGFEKNRALAESGTIYPVRRDLDETLMLKELVADLDKLNRLRHRSVAFVEETARFGLAEALVEVLEGKNGV